MSRPRLAIKAGGAVRVGPAAAANGGAAKAAAAQAYQATLGSPYLPDVDPRWACHEAGHVVALLALGRAVKVASCIEEGASAYVLEAEVMPPGPDLALVACSGAAAEEVLARREGPPPWKCTVWGESGSFSDSDFANLKAGVGDDPAAWNDAWNAARSLLGAHRGPLGRVCDLLLRRGVVPGDVLQAAFDARDEPMEFRPTVFLPPSA